MKRDNINWKSKIKRFYVEWVFDCLHMGHITFLEYIRAKINYFYWPSSQLIVWVEGNKLVKKKKGKNRPIQDETVRLENIKKLHVVDIAFIIDDDFRNRIEFLKKINVNYFVIPEEYLSNKIAFFLFKKFFLKKLKKSGIRVIFSRHKQYSRFWVSTNYQNIHTTTITKSSKFGKKLNEILYLSKEALFLVFQK